MIIWKYKKVDQMPVYTGHDEHSEYEIRSWPYDESGEGKIQLCVDGYHKGNFKTMKEAKAFAERGW